MFASGQQTTNYKQGLTQQSIQRAYGNALEFSLLEDEFCSGGTTCIPFTTIADYERGVESSQHWLRVRSMKEFGISVKTRGRFFDITKGSNTTSSNMPTSVLQLLVTDNYTGGALGEGFSFSSYRPLSTKSTPLIWNAENGNNQYFSIKYKATPGFNYPAGIYSTYVIYTATQQ